MHLPFLRNFVAVNLEASFKNLQETNFKKKLTPLLKKKKKMLFLYWGYILNETCLGKESWYSVSNMFSAVKELENNRPIKANP